VLRLTAIHFRIIIYKNPTIKTYIIILSTVSYWCQTWSLALGKEYRLFENKAVSRIFGPRAEALTEEWRKSDN
jgi:hypothetical protein